MKERIKQYFHNWECDKCVMHPLSATILIFWLAAIVISTYMYITR